jgi:hypothetical protein
MPEKPNTPNTVYEFSQDSAEVYGNNVLYESSAWDFKFLFGQLDQSGQVIGGPVKAKTVIHTAVTVPWPQAKLMLYWLKGHIEAHELVNGKIRMPKNTIPEYLQLPEEIRKSDPNAEAVFQIFERLRRELVEEQKL